MNLLEYLDRAGQRRLEYRRAVPRRPLDVRAFIGLLFLAGYYVMVWRFQTRALPAANLDLIRDAMLTLGPPVGIIVGAMFRDSVRDEIAAQNTGEGFRAISKQAEATKAAAESTPPGASAGQAADAVAGAAAEEADRIQGRTTDA